jgi:ankyrin repeat protein
MAFYIVFFVLLFNIEKLYSKNLHDAQDPQIIHELIIQGHDVNKKRYGITPLYQALLDENRQKVMILLSSGARLNIRSQGSTPLQWAIEHNDYELVLAFLKEKAKVNASIIAKAHSLGFHDIAQLLTKFSKLNNKKVDINALDSNGLSKMHYAVLYGDTISFDALVAHKACINVKGSDGQTPLHSAICSNPSMVHKVLSLHPAVNVQDNASKTPLAYAQQYGLDDIQELLIKQGALH